MPAFDILRAAQPGAGNWYLRRFLQGWFVQEVARGCHDLCAREVILLS